MHVHAGLVPAPRHGGMDPVLERRARRVGEEPRERLQFRDREQSPWAQHPVDLRDRPCGIAHVVQRVGGPHQVSGLQVLRPCLIEVGLDGADPVGKPGRASLVLDVLQHLFVDVQRDHLGVRQLPGQRQGAGARAGAHVDDAGSSGEAGRDPFGYLPVVLAEDLRVEVEQVSQVFVCHVLDGTAVLPLRHRILRMKQDADLDALVRQRIRGLRTSLGWSLDELAARSYLSPSTLSRIETGHRRIALDQLTPIARALGTTLDQLVESADDADVVIRPHRDEARGMTTWLLSRTGAPQGMTIAKLRVTRPVPARLRVHPGRDWFTVLSGTIVLRLGERTILVRAGEAAEFSTMEPHAFGVREGAAEMLCILDHDGTRTHLGPGGPFPETGPGET
jgi:transcriptional regulator with XRE-family HTH domain